MKKMRVLGVVFWFFFVVYCRDILHMLYTFSLPMFALFCCTLGIMLMSIMLATSSQTDTVVLKDLRSNRG